jgi:hypothetical protein
VPRSAIGTRNKNQISSAYLHFGGGLFSFSCGSGGRREKVDTRRSHWRLVVLLRSLSSHRSHLLYTSPGTNRSLAEARVLAGSKRTLVVAQCFLRSPSSLGRESKMSRREESLQVAPLLVREILYAAYKNNRIKSNNRPIKQAMSVSAEFTKQVRLQHSPRTIECDFHKSYKSRFITPFAGCLLALFWVARHSHGHDLSALLALAL